MKDLKLWGIFISLIIVVQALGFFVFSGIAWCLFHAGILSPDHPPMGWFPFLTNTCSSALISLYLTDTVGNGATDVALKYGQEYLAIMMVGLIPGPGPCFRAGICRKF